MAFGHKIANICLNCFIRYYCNDPTDCLSVFDSFVGLALKGLKFCVRKR